MTLVGSWGLGVGGSGECKGKPMKVGMKRDWEMWMGWADLAAAGVAVGCSGRGWLGMF